MCLWLKKLWDDEAGVIISAELILILTIVVLGVIVGLVQVRSAIVAEFHDLGLAFSHLNQSYGFSGYRGTWKPWCGWTSWTAGSSFIDLYEGSNLTAYTDMGYVGGGVTYYGGGAAIGGGAVSSGGACVTSSGCGSCATDQCGVVIGRLGTIVLADGTLIPISLAAKGTWSLPGGALLVEYADHPGMLVLADGTMIAYLIGGPGVVELTGDVHIATRPGNHGSLVLSDGRTATLSATEANAVVLADGTAGRWQAANLDQVVLSNGTMVAVTTGEVGTLVLPDGRVLRLSDAVVPAGTHATQPVPDHPGTPSDGFQPGNGVLHPAPIPEPTPLHQGGVSPDAPPVPQLPGSPEPEAWTPSQPVNPRFVPQPGGRRGLPTYKRFTPGQRLNLEIPAGPIPQYLPQV